MFTNEELKVLARLSIDHQLCRLFLTGNFDLGRKIMASEVGATIALTRKEIDEYRKQPCINLTDDTEAVAMKIEIE